MRRRSLGYLMSALLLPPVAIYAGGWATITVEELPDYAVAGQPLELAFTVRQHGEEAMSGLRASIEGRSGRHRVEARARAGEKAGQYAVSLTLPEPGDWSLTIRSGFGPSDLTLLPIRAIAPGAAAPAALTDAERGRRLFVAKGCVTCHVHGTTNEKSMVPGPELTHKRFEAGYLKGWLANPTRRAGSLYPTLAMPNLSLAEREIAALVSFLNAEGRSASK
ncbi:MAG TPA: c-type cytochrome [Gemmatimonadaceae bacterium]|nr:c-type cytochrome [Gemmatimonadaceae bacterium]